MKQRFTSLIVSLAMLGQIALPGVALASEEPTPSPSPSASPSASPQPSSSPGPSASPSPSASVSPSPSPSTSASPAPSASPTASPSPSPARGAGKTGPDEPTGVVPDYVFDTVSGTWVEADKGSFSYDKAKGLWLSPKYYYDTRIGWYKIIPASAPKPDYLVSAPQVIRTAFGDIVVGSPEYQMARLMGVIGPNGQPTGSAAISGTGAGSDNKVGIANNNQEWFDFTSLVNVISTLQSAAKSGDVAADGNTQVGDAVSGAALVLANVINLLASAWSWSDGNLSYFMQNIFGNHNGDLLLQPTQSASGGGGRLGGSVSTDGTGPNSNNEGTVTNNNGLRVNANATANITNNIDVEARSGDAAATHNSSVGDVRTGDAFAQVNIINLINSFINSGSSFFGILNIFGSLNGDILFPDGFLDGLLGSDEGGRDSADANGTGPGSSNGANINNSSDTSINNTANYGVANNVNSTAQSGSANVGNNSSAGNGSSGRASTTNSLFNLTNSQIFGDNAVLVIVNVMGRWVGRIMHVAGGSTTSALLTGNAQVSHNQTGSNSNNQGNVTNTSTADINQRSVGTITNNVNVRAQSGDATATGNSKVGDVATGEAKAGTSVANIVNSALNVKRWFGVLVINVFGDWTGSVNEDTAAGDGPVGRGAGSDAAAAPGPTAILGVTMARILAPTSLTSGGSASASDTADGYQTAGPTQVIADAALAGSGAVLAGATALPSVATAAAKGAHLDLLLLGSALLLLVSGAVFSLERRLRRR